MANHILISIGTRPELIKMAPVVDALRRRDHKVTVVFTGQHRELLEDVAECFGIEPDVQLHVMVPGQTMVACQQRLMDGLDQVIRAHQPDMVMSQGDTMTVYCSAMAAFLNQVPFAHVEAGLRSANLFDPFPEEGLRRAVSALTSLHFAPTAIARANLLREGHAPNKIWVVGNTCIDALMDTVHTRRLRLPEGLEQDSPIVLVTVHRRENHGEVLHQILQAVLELAHQHRDHQFVLPVHPNPAVHDVVHQVLGDVPNIKLTPPLGYSEFVSCLACAKAVVTDSGGVQEEAPALGVPVLVIRKTTERPEGVMAGVSELVGVETRGIVERTSAVLSDPVLHRRMSRAASPYGDGHAAERIVDVLSFGQCVSFQPLKKNKEQPWMS